MKYTLFLILFFVPFLGIGQIAQGAPKGVVVFNCFDVKGDSIKCKIINVSNESIFLIDYPISNFEDSYFDKSFGNRDILSIPKWKIPIKLMLPKDYVVVSKKLDSNKFKEVTVSVDFLKDIEKKRFLRKLRKKKSNSILGKKLYKYRKCLYNYAETIPVIPMNDIE